MCFIFKNYLRLFITYLRQDIALFCFFGFTQWSIQYLRCIRYQFMIMCIASIDYLTIYRIGYFKNNNNNLIGYRFS